MKTMQKLSWDLPVLAELFKKGYDDEGYGKKRRPKLKSWFENFARSLCGPTWKLNRIVAYPVVKKCVLLVKLPN